MYPERGYPTEWDLLLLGHRILLRLMIEFEPGEASVAGPLRTDFVRERKSGRYVARLAATMPTTNSRADQKATAGESGTALFADVMVNSATNRTMMPMLALRNHQHGRPR